MCRTGCPTQDHATWGECARAAVIQIDNHSLKVDLRLEKDKDRRLDRYASLRKHRVQPRNTAWKNIRDAEERGGVGETKKGTPDRNAYKFNREEAYG